MQAEATFDETYTRPTLALPLGHLIRISLYWLGLTAIDGAVGLFIQNRVNFGPFAADPLEVGRILFLLSIPYLFVALSFGTFVSTKSNSQSEAMQMSFMIFIPTIFLSGYVFPIETMPTFFQWLTYIVPATYYVDTARGIILRGAGFRELWVNGAVLVGMGASLLVIAAARFHKKVIAA